MDNKCRICKIEGNRYLVCEDCLKKHYNKDLKYYNKKQQKIINLRLKNKTYKEIGEIFGLTPPRVHEIFKGGIDKVIYQKTVNKEK